VPVTIEAGTIADADRRCHARLSVIVPHSTSW
jgi:hypothetical protein